MEDVKREMLGQQHDAVEAEEAAMMMPSTSTSKSINVDQQTTNAHQSEMGGEQPQEELLVVEDNEQLNEALESYAKAHNLTAQKVKNIIFHIVKNPQTFATLIRKDPDAMAGLRMTRSRLRQLERIARRRILPPELKPINVPKTFLDVNYGEEGDGEDTEDADYTPAGGDVIKIKTEREATDNDDDESKEGDDVLSSSASADEASSSNEEEEEEEEDEPTMEGEHLEQQNKGHESGRKSRMENGEEMLGMEAGAMNDGLDSARGDFLTEVDNPIYSHFVKSVMGGVGDAELDDPFTRALYNEEDDSEYVFHEFDEFCAGDDGEEGEEEEDEDEFRRDRATEIPRWELRALEQDFVDSALPNVPVDEGGHGSTPTKGMMKQRPWSRQQQQQQHSNYNRHEQLQRISGEESSSIRRTASAVQSGSGSTTTTESTTTKTTKVVITETRAARTTTTVPPPENVNSSSSSESCSLLVPPEQLRFTDTELRALKVQMEKHVQLLCQCIVGTSQYPELLDPRNRAVTMLCDLDELAQQRLDQPSSLFHVDNLHAAVFSAHDIQACHEVDLPLKKWEGQPSKETMWVLARSEACRYPELMPCRQFKLFDQMHSHFLRSEQLLLALALHQLRHVPFAGSKPAPFAPKSAPPVKRGRYPLIVDHFLANKSVQQIRNYLKNVRACPSPTLLQRIVCQAERGIFHVNYRPDLGENGQRQIPLNWPEEQQPLWLKWLASLFRQGNVEIMAVTTVSMSTTVPAAIEANTTITETTAPTAIELDNEKKLKRRRRNSPNTIDELEEESTSRKKWAKVDEGVEVEMVHDEQQPPQSAGEEEEEEEGQQMENSNNKRRRRDSSADGTAATTGCFGCCTTSGPDETSNEQFPVAAPFAAATSAGSASATSNNHQKQQQEGDANNMGGNGNGTARQDSMVEEQQQQGKEEAAEEAGGGTTSAATTTTTIGAESQQQQSQRKSRRRLRAEKGLAALCSQPARDNVMRALVEAIYGDFKQRMFMHQDKLRTVQSILHRPGLSTAERFSHLWQQLGQSHPQSFFLFAAVAPDHELPPSLRAHPDRMASKQALNMVHTIQSYMAGSRSAVHTRNTFRFLREARDALTSEDRLFEALQRHFGVRDEPLWKLLRRQWLGARFAEKIEDWQFETVDLDKVQQQADPTTTTGIGMEENGLLRFETVKLPYRHDPTERSRLRVRHGRVTVELNGRLRSVAIEYPQQPAPGTQSNIGSPEEKQPIKAVLPTADHQQQASKSTKIISGTSTAQGQQPVAEIAWTRELDAALLIGFSEAGRDRHKCIANFLASPCCCGRRFSREDVANRLQSLVNVARQLQQQHQKGK